MKTITAILLLLAAFTITGRADFASLDAKQHHCETLQAAATEGQYQRVMPSDVVECDNAGVPLPVSIETILEYHAINQ